MLNQKYDSLSFCSLLFLLLFIFFLALWYHENRLYLQCACIYNCQGSTRKPVWIQEKQRNNRHDLYSTSASRKMPGTECGPLHNLCRPYQSIWHCQSWSTLENYGKVWLSCQIHSNGAGSCMMVCLQGSKMMASFLIYFLWQMVLSKAVY